MPHEIAPAAGTAYGLVQLMCGNTLDAVQRARPSATASPLPRQPLRVWMARDASLTSPDSVEAALALLAEGMTTRDAFPMASETAECNAISISARCTSPTGFTAVDLAKIAPARNGRMLQIPGLAEKFTGGWNLVCPS